MRFVAQDAAIRTPSPLDKPNYEHIKPPKVTKKTKTKKELENQENVYEMNFCRSPLPIETYQWNVFFIRRHGFVVNNVQQPEIIDFERSNSSNCHEEISVNELASYLEFSTLIPRKMSSMAESIYG